MTPFENQVLEKIKAKVKAIEPNAELILFGSRSRGEANENSDFDLLINTDREVSMGYELQLQTAIYDIELEMDVLIEAFLFSKKQWDNGSTPSPLIESVRREGVVI
jgi:predicted nucleotidyltransferase